MAQDDLAWLTAGFAVFWACLFYFLAYTHSCWSERLPESSKEHENDRWWVAWQCSGTVHAILASAIALPAMFQLMLADRQIKFISTDSIEWCLPEENSVAYALLQEVDLLDLTTQIAFVGLMFTVYTAVDLVVALVHGLAGIDYLIHHVAFIVAGVLIRSNCMLPFNAAVLISMEVSNLPLNYMMFFRHREGYNCSVTIASVLFAVTFFVFRIGINTYGAGFLLWHQDESTPPRVPLWQRYFILTAIVVGALLQFWWGHKVIESMLKALGKKDSVEKDADTELESLDSGTDESSQDSLL